MPRNKLVKRAASHRALQSSHGSLQTSSKSQLPTLRRPATSHQRSETFQSQYFHDVKEYEESASISHKEALDQNSSMEDNPTHVFYPLFRPRPPKVPKDTSRKRDSIGGLNSNRGSIRCISAMEEDLPTLLMAGSIYPIPSEEGVQGLTTPLDHRSSLIDLHTPSPLSTQAFAQSTSSYNYEQKPRNSFAISDIFSSPSPSTWKLARSGSLRRKKETGNGNVKRRVSSAPLPSKGRRLERKGYSGLKPDLRTNASLDAIDGSLRDRQSSIIDSRMRNPSSPIPPLDRLSAFEVDLADTTLSCPTSPQLKTPPSPQFLTSPITTTLSNGPKRIPSTGKSYRPSGVYSDRGSTLVGSDNENSRFSGGDGDETDYRSDTIYDSIRTGATGSSHSGVRGPRIDTVFDAIPPPELLKQNLVALQNSLLSDPVAHLKQQSNFIAEEEESIHTPIKFRHSLEDNFPTPAEDTYGNYSSPKLPSPLPPAYFLSKRSQDGNTREKDSRIDGIWASDEAENSSWDDEGEVEELHSDHRMDSLLGSGRKVKSGVEEQIVPDVPLSHQDRPKSNIFEWSERSHIDREAQQGSSPRPKTVHGKQDTERGSRSAGRRGPSALHLRSQSVPLPPDGSTHRGINSTSKLDAWLLGNKGVSEEWDGDFEFEESEPASDLRSDSEALKQPTGSGVIVVPQAILERQASVHGQFGQVKELTSLVEELKRLRHQANAQGILGGQSAELWKEAEGIINLATLDDEEHDFLVPRSPHSPGLDADPFEDESPSSQRQRRSGLSLPNDSTTTKYDHTISPPAPSHLSPTGSKSGTPAGRPRKESVATAKSVLENIHHHRSSHSPPLTNTRSPQKKLPFDTTSLRDLVTRAGVVTRALKEIVRRAQNAPQTPERYPDFPPDPPFSQMFHQPTGSPVMNKSPRMVKNSSSNSFLGGSISANDNDINGRMKMMTVV